MTPKAPRRRHLVWSPSTRPDDHGPLLLDTHLWVWMLDPALGALPAGIRPLLERAAAARELLVSDISAWEVAQKVARGRLSFTSPVEAWIARAVLAPGVTMLPLSRDALVLSTQLATLHGDPADRILVATAKLMGVPLATADRQIAEWARAEGRTPVCWVGRGRGTA